MQWPALLSTVLTPELFQEAIDHLDQGLVCFDAQQRLVCFNRRYAELLELPAAFLQGETDKPAIVAYQRQRGDFDPPARFFDAQGLTLHPDPLTDEMPPRYWRSARSGQVLEVHVARLATGLQVRSFTDVTPYFAAQRGAQHNAARLQRVLDALDPGTWETNLVTGQVEINEAWAGVLGYRRAELEPMTRERWRAMLHPDDLAPMRLATLSFLTGADRQFDQRFRMRHRLGHWVWVRCTGKNYEGVRDDGSLVISGTLLDISEKMQAIEHCTQRADHLQHAVEDQHRQIERTVQDMAMISASLAHDLRTPLRSINGYASILAEHPGGVDADTAHRYAKTIADQSATMGRMISSMLDLLQVLQAQPVQAPLRVSDLARTLMQRLCDDPALAVDFVCPDTPPETTDPELLGAALEHLLRNALTYAEEQVRPRIELGHDPQEGVYFVRDNGIGFDMALADRLFKLFSRLNPANAASGLGMGLAIARRSIERLGGRLWVSSAPRQGSTFYFTLGG